MACFIVDFENVNSAGLWGITDLTEDDTVFIFYSVKANTLTFTAHMDIMKSKAKVEYFPVTAGGRNALDFQLATYLGYCVSRGIEREYYIISNDMGFDFVKNFWNGREESGNAGIRRTNTISKAISDIKTRNMENELVHDEIIHEAYVMSNAGVDKKKAASEENDGKEFDFIAVAEAELEYEMPEVPTVPMGAIPHVPQPVNAREAAENAAAHSEQPAVSDKQPEVNAEQPEAAEQTADNEELPFVSDEKPTALQAEAANAPEEAQTAEAPAPSEKEEEENNTDENGRVVIDYGEFTEVLTPKKKRGRPEKKRTEQPKAKPIEVTVKKEAPADRAAVITDKVTLRILDLAAGTADVDEAVDIAECLRKSDGKQNFYRTLMKMYGMEHGGSIYRKIKSEYTNMKKMSEE